MQIRDYINADAERIRVALLALIAVKYEPHASAETRKCAREVMENRQLGFISERDMQCQLIDIYCAEFKRLNWSGISE